MKKKLIIALLCTLCFSLFGLVACNDNAGNGSGNGSEHNSSKGDNTSPDIVTTDIGKVLTDGKNNSDVAVDGTVFGKTSEGFYVSDNTGSIFVLSSETVNKGDDYKIQGKYVLRNGEPVVNYAQLEKVSQGNKTLTATKSTVSEIAAKDAADKTAYAKYYEVVAVVSKDEANRYILTEDSVRVIVESKSDASALEKWIGSKVQLNVVTYAKTSEGWSVSFVDDADSVKETALDVNTVKDAVFTAVDAVMPNEVYGMLTLPMSYEAEPSIKYTWTVTEGQSAVIVKDNIATVNEISTDTAVTMKLTITSGSTSAEKSYSFTVKALRTVEIDKVAATSFGANENFYTQGVVVSKARNQSGSLFTLILKGETSYLRMDFAKKEDVESYNLGDTVKVLSSSAFKAVRAQTVKAADKNYKNDYATMPQQTLSADAECAALAKADYTGAMLYRIENPYLVYSGNTTYNYVRFGASADKAANGYENVKLCFLIDNLAFTGANEAFDAIEINKLNAGAKQYYGYIVYAFCVYGGGMLQFTVPEASAVIVDESGIAESEILSAVTTTSFDTSSAGGTFTLPASTEKAGAITWTSDNEKAISISGNTATYAKNVAATVKLTASYKVSGKNCATEIVITLTTAPIKTLTVSEAIAAGDGKIDLLEAYYIGVAPGHSGSGTDACGFYVSDGKKVLTVTTFGGAIAANGYGYTADGIMLKVGDKIELQNVTLSGKTLACSESTGASIKSYKKDLSKYELIASSVISSDEDLAAYMANITKLQSTNNRTYDVVKVVATEENPIYFGATAKYFLTFYYLGADEDGTKLSQAKYTLGDEASTLGSIGNHSLALAATLGDDWVLNNTPQTKLGAYDNLKATTTPNKDGDAYKFTGSFYFIFEYAGSAKYPYMYCGILGAGFNLVPVTAV